ncbi:hypothetical protein PF010_g2955 [Phytophthora fragariae]|uniref:Uncharacterized protein n=1 Tax=Phytophthora fragariae TaxID=53985 RepID=A0A6A3M8T9_9STRA|nr:hypothetical protein PF003_g1357 [Phytophthora fragariae]KAE9026125.1 hypothetical protein PF011_g2704 [Phytophthora fragariae]KAE9133009.1 hypothetical protein PF010_g2955 [Phytophthora fragariae]
MARGIGCTFLLCVASIAVGDLHTILDTYTEFVCVSKIGYAFGGHENTIFDTPTKFMCVSKICYAFGGHTNSAGRKLKLPPTQKQPPVVCLSIRRSAAVPGGTLHMLCLRAVTPPSLTARSAILKSELCGAMKIRLDRERRAQEHFHQNRQATLQCSL